MTDWTAARLHEQPELTIIEYARDTADLTAVRVDYGDGDDWLVLDSGDCLSSAELLEDADHGSIRVVSVPVAALLSDETVWHSGKHPHLLGKSVEIPRSVLKSAIAHVTGGSDG